jgi:hypothetical protein
METVNVEGFLSSEPAATITALLKLKSSLKLSRAILHGFKITSAMKVLQSNYKIGRRRVVGVDAFLWVSLEGMGS